MLSCLFSGPGTDVSHVLNVSAEELKTVMETMAKTTLTSYQVIDLYHVMEQMQFDTLVSIAGNCSEIMNKLYIY